MFVITSNLPRVILAVFTMVLTLGLLVALQLEVMIGFARFLSLSYGGYG